MRISDWSSDVCSSDLYCIAVANSGSAAATSVAITDPVPGQLTFNAGSILLGGTVTSGTCDFNGAAGGSYAAPNVSGTIASIAAGTASTDRKSTRLNSSH